MLYRNKLFIFGLFLIFSSCQDARFQLEEDTHQAENNTGYNTSMEIRVAVCAPSNDPQCLDAYGAPGATVSLFLTEEDREYSEPVYRTGTTSGQEGTVLFSGIEAGKRFYIRTIYSGQEVESSDTAPVNGIARHEVLFFE